MVFQAELLTVLVVALLGWGLYELLRPFWSRLYRYWCALKQQDAEQCDEFDRVQMLKAKAREELDSVCQPPAENKNEEHP